MLTIVYRQITSSISPLKNEQYYYNYANTLQAAGHFKSSLEMYEKALAINPGNPNSHNNIGSVLGEWERFDEARQQLEKAAQSIAA